MKASRVLRYARQRVHLTQRELADRAGVPQSTIARIESGAVDPRFGTLSRLLRFCGYDFEVEPALGLEVDRSLIQTMLSLTPAQRMASAVQTIRFMQKLRLAARKSA